MVRSFWLRTRRSQVRVLQGAPLVSSIWRDLPSNWLGGHQFDGPHFAPESANRAGVQPLVMAPVMALSYNARPCGEADRDGSGISATVSVARSVQREKRFPPETPLKVVQRWRQLKAEELRTNRPRIERAPRPRTLRCT